MPALIRRRKEAGALRRLHQLQVVSAVAIQISAVRAVDQLFWEIVRQAQSALGYYYVHISIIDPDRRFVVCRAGWDQSGPRRDLVGWRQRLKNQGIVGWVGWSGESLSVPDVRTDERYYADGRFPYTRSELAVPILREGKVIGVLDAQNRKADAFDDGDRLVMETLARQIAVALENAELFERLAASQEALEREARGLDEFVEMASAAQENDRRRIALDLHDGVVQLLVGSRMEVETMRIALGPLAAEMEQRFDLVLDVLRDCSVEIRQIVFDLSPPDLAKLGLVPTVQRYVQTLSRLFNRDGHLSVSGDVRRLTLSRELAAFRFIQETLANAYKHAGDAPIEVALQFTEDDLTIVVDDNGPGFDFASNSRAGRFGLESIRRNAVRANGRFDVQSSPGAGTIVSLTMPILDVTS